MESRMASQTNPSVWITANAGSGKTTYLTRRVVGLLLAGVSPERICCITYTKAAASEMRHRVLGLLRELLLLDDTACRGKVGGLLGREASAEEITRARSLFGLVLDSAVGGVQLTTIHGFCQNILRRFPLEAGIAPHFTLLEEESAQKLLARAKHRLLGQYNAGDPALNAAFEMIGNRSSEARFDTYVAHIVSQRRRWEGMWRGQSVEGFRARLFQFHGLEDGDEQALSSAFCECVEEVHLGVIRAHLPMMAAHKNKTEQATALVLQAWIEGNGASRLSMIDAFSAVFLTQEGSIRKKLVAKDLEGTPLHRVMVELAARAERYAQQCAALACAQESFAVALLARALLEAYEREKEAVYGLDYDDLIAKTRELFANPAMLGWVMSKLDHRIDHLLVDEAQDTSGEQWAIAQALVEELIAASDGIGSGGQPRSLLVVGDEKQSIYSFQGAAPQLFADKKGEFEAMLSGSYSPLMADALTNSYRSAEAVLKLVDDVAAQPEIAAALSAGERMPHQLKRMEAAGSVTLYPPLMVPEVERVSPLTLPVEYHTSQTAAQLLAEEVAQTVAGWFASGRMLESAGRPLVPGDVLVLVRSRQPLVLPLIRALEKYKVPVAGLDRLTLSSHLAVRDVLAAMRFVLNLGDDLALAHVLRSPIVGISDDQLQVLAVGRSGSLWTQLTAAGSASEWLHAREMVQRLLSARAQAPYEFLTAMLEVHGARRRFAERFGAEVHEVLDELKAQAARMPAGMAPTLANFHDWMEGSAREIKREQEDSSAGRLRIMTVHGAKGLEASVVLMIDTSNVPTTQREAVFFASDAARQNFPLLAISEDAKTAPQLVAAKQAKLEALMAEYYRLLYVALTRARDELHVWGIAGRSGEVAEASWYAAVARSMRGLGAEDVVLPAHERAALCLRDMRSPVTPKAAEEKTRVAALPEWTLGKAPSLVTARTVMTPSSLASQAEVSRYVQTAGADARARGVRIHRILELLTGDCDVTIIARLVALLGADWEASEQASVTAHVASLLAQQRWIWALPSHAEVTICGTLTIGDQEIAVNGQIDRLVETPEAWVILDYKTGSHVPKTAADISENYRLQLKTYQALVAKLYPDKPVRTAILWTAAPLLMWCDEAVAATAWPNQFVIHSAPLVA